MRNSEDISVSFCQETYRPQVGSVLRAVASRACQVVTDAPFDASVLPFFEAAKACDWLASASERLCAEIVKTEAALPTRLRAIKQSAEVLLEHSYAKNGRLEATHFIDGSWVRYEYDEMVRMVRVNLNGSRIASRQFRADGSLESCIYAGGGRFDFGYDHVGRLARVQYPDRVATAFTRTPAGTTSGVVVGDLEFSLCWSSAGELEGCAVEQGGLKDDLQLGARAIEWPSYGRSAGKAVSTGAAHPLGAWIASETGGLSELITPLGERWVLSETGPHGPRRVWTSSGQTEYQYDGAGVLSAVIAPDGSRSVFHRVHGRRIALLVSPGGVTLFTYGTAGYLRTMHEISGAYSLLRYRRGGMLSQIDTLRGKTKLRWNCERQLSSLTWPDGLNCVMKRGSAGRLESLVVEGLAPGAAWRLQELTSGLWSWLAARPTLRLVDAGLLVEKGAER